MKTHLTLHTALRTVAVALLLSAGGTGIHAQGQGHEQHRQQLHRGDGPSDEVTLTLKHTGKLAEEFPKEMTGQVRVLHLRGTMDSNDLRFLKRLASRTKVVDAEGKSVKAYLDLDLSEARWPHRGLGVNKDSEEMPSSTFANCQLLRHVILPYTTEAVGNQAFQGCKALTRVELPRDVATIGHSAFSDCTSLAQLNLPRGIRAIGDGAFKGCKALRDIYLPDGLESLGKGVFEGCESLTELSVPEGLTDIPDNTFSGCRQLKKVVLPTNTLTIGAECFKNCSLLTGFALPGGLTRLGSGALYGCKGITTLRLPRSLTVIPSKAFAYTGIKSIALHEGITSIGNHAFLGTALQQIHLPASVTQLSSAALHGCTSLQAIHVEQANSHFSSANGILYNAGKTSLIQVPGAWQGTVTVAETATRIEAMAVMGCSQVTAIDMPQTVTYIGADAFNSTAITQIIFPQGIKAIPDGVCSNCTQLTDIQLPAGITSIGTDAFAGTRPATIALPEGVMTIGEHAFHKCVSITELTLPGSLTKIGDEAFCGCKSLTQLKIRENTAAIGEKIVYDCDSLRTFICLCPTPPTVKKVTNGKAALVVPAASVALYKKAKGWKKFHTISGI